MLIVLALVSFSASVNAQDDILNEGNNEAQECSQDHEEEDTDNKYGEESSHEVMTSAEETENTDTNCGWFSSPKKNCKQFFRRYGDRIFQSTHLALDLLCVISSIMSLTAIEPADSHLEKFNDPNCTAICADDYQHIQQHLNTTNIANICNLVFTGTMAFGDLLLWRCFPKSHEEYNSGAANISALPTCFSILGFASSLVSNGFVWNIDRNLLTHMPNNIKDAVQRLMTEGIINVVAMGTRTTSGITREVCLQKTIKRDKKSKDRRNKQRKVITASIAN